MLCLISDTFMESLWKLNSNEQKAVKNTVFDLQTNPSNPGLNFHKLQNVKDENFCSVRVSRDIRIIVHRTDKSLLICYVDHHDDAYKWAECRKMETHPKTGAAQLVKVRETVKEIEVPEYTTSTETISSKPQLFTHLSDDELLNYGIPSEWLNDVKNADEETLLELTDHLPDEAAEVLLELATGGKPELPEQLINLDNPFDHPDSQRRFRIMNNIDELKQALDYPWEKWAIFLHPLQKRLVEKDYNGPARISGSAGTGKTVVALHRSVHLAKSNPDSRILLTTFSAPLARYLNQKLYYLIGSSPRLAERIEVHDIKSIGEKLYAFHFTKPQIASKSDISKSLQKAYKDTKEQKFSPNFLMSEWENVIDSWQIENWEAYRDVMRLGRKTRLPEKQRKSLWNIFEQVKTDLEEKKLLTYANIFTQLSEYYENNVSPYEYIVVDESQDISISELRFFASIGNNRPNSLFFTGDLGQRIFQQPYSWKSLGVDIRGRSHALKVNYRTSHQIRVQADRLLDEKISDVDGITEERKGTISVFNGPEPYILKLQNTEKEISAVAEWIKKIIKEGINPEEIGIFVRSKAELERAKASVEKADLPYTILDEKFLPQKEHISIATMHLAKGLEFRAVVVMACDDEVIPLQERIDNVSDIADLEDVYNTERHLLYVACTRARDYLLISGVKPASEFIDDLKI